ncbi:MAG: hypothetical protein CMP06_03240 [Xanthomonadales bacterium]|jgi:hypothetical protein|nr:hypothetical protein [Xanthomonadales bacterium]
MRQVLFFDSMVTPRIITVVYWLLLFSVVWSGVGFMFIGFGGFSFGKFLLGLCIMGGGALGARIWCELLIVLFKMNEALQDIRQRPSSAM